MSHRNNSAISRLRMDYMRLKKDPVPYIVAEPLPSNILIWHYVVTGPKSSLYEGGYYHGQLCFPAEFPFKPPSIYMHTPSGRFKPNTRLCLSISDYHPDTWNPAWSVATILTGLLSFMLEKSPTLGSVESSDKEKRIFAERSHEFNLKNKTFCELFPEIVDKSRSIIEENKITKPAETNCQEKNLNSQKKEESSGIHTAMVNFIVIALFACFAMIVQYVIQSFS